VFLIILQEDIGTVAIERVKNLREEDHTKVKTEEDYIQLVRTVKCEQGVSVLFTGVCVCVLYCTLCLVTNCCHNFISHLFNLRVST
jgi:hypothetical protein